MEYRRMKNTIIARIDKGEEILEKVKELALTENIKLASVQALGAIGDFTVGVLNRKYKTGKCAGTWSNRRFYGRCFKDGRKAV